MSKEKRILKSYFDKNKVLSFLFLYFVALIIGGIIASVVELTVYKESFTLDSHFFAIVLAFIACGLELNRYKKYRKGWIDKHDK